MGYISEAIGNIEHSRRLSKELGALKAANIKLRKALSELVGAETKEELADMERALRLMPGIERDKVSAINAIHALQDTAP